ncbi:unnamed protein product [Urochloa decumbens]|uniref:F-box domain-containing protein n=1 Tax=Urochloa decumbens TaxID=240449 RepID=A0ABC9FAI5_9POAL
MASPARSILPRLEPTASLRQPATLTDDVLEEIFLRVASHADLARASTACVSFRRLIADHSFLRRFRSRHPPLLLGFLSAAGQGFLPLEAPHPNAPASRALGSAAGFSFDYLPHRVRLEWCPCDVRDGRVLLECRSLFHRKSADSFVFGEFAVCDPLSRQYMLLPRIPEDLLASVQIKQGNIDDFGASLVPSGVETGRTHHSECCAQYIGGQDLSQLAYGCCYWKVRNQNELLKLDINTMEFSTIDLPPDHNMRSIAIVEAGEGNLGMFSETADVRIKSVEYYTFMQNGNGRANGWDLKNTIPTDDYFGTFICSAGGYIFLARPNINARPQRFEYLYSSLEIKTYNIERVSILEFPANYPYFGFPPSMSPRRIQI